MSPTVDEPRDTGAGAAALLARAEGADAAEARRLESAIDDFFLPDDARLDDEVRAAIGDRITRAVAAAEREVATFAERGLGRPLARGVTPRLLASGLLRDAPLMAELIGRARQDLLGEALRSSVAPSDRSNLLARLTECPDGVVAAAAAAMLAADNRGRTERIDLSPMVHQRLVWWVAAALREQGAGGPAFDRGLADAAARSISANASAVRLDAAAMRLASAIDPRPDELGDLLIGALADARPALFFAGLAHSASLDFAQARAIALDPGGDRLWLVLRAQGLHRAEIAQIGLILSEADRRRDVETFADLLDSIVAVERDDAVAALAPMRLHPEFHAAMRALTRTRA
jgi:hypothetical protein